MRNPQLTKNGELQHLLTIDGLPREILTAILDTASPFTEVAEREVKKVPLLRGKSVFNLFFENSTRTRTTFEIAAKRLSADVINLNINTSSTSKGETLLDTVDNLVAMHADMFVVRHAASGAPFLIAQHLAARVGAATCTSSTPATGATRIRRRACSTCTPSAITKGISAISWWRLSATCCIRAWPVPRSKP